MARVRSVDALRDGVARVNRAPAILISVFAVTFLTAVPFAAMMRDALKTHLGGSLAGEQALSGVNQIWWSEFTAQAGEIGQTFETAIIGFAAVLDNISAVLDGDARAAPIVWLGAAYLLVWLFLTGGIVDRYARGRPTRSYGFFTACGVYFVRFLRLAPVIAATYYLLFAFVRPLLLNDLYGEFTRSVTAEHIAFLWRSILYLIFGALVIGATILFDYAKVRAVVEDRRSMIGAVVSSGRFVRRNLGAVLSLYAMNAMLFLVVLLVYALVAPDATDPTWVVLAFGQTYVLARLWVRLVFFASETALFQARLAHTGYIASPPVNRPEPPVVEQLISPGVPRS